MDGDVVGYDDGLFVGIILFVAEGDKDSMDTGDWDMQDETILGWSDANEDGVGVDRIDGREDGLKDRSADGKILRLIDGWPLNLSEGICEWGEDVVKEGFCDGFADCLLSGISERKSLGIKVVCPKSTDGSEEGFDTDGFGDLFGLGAFDGSLDKAACDGFSEGAVIGSGKAVGNIKARLGAAEGGNDIRNSELGGKSDTTSAKVSPTNNEDEEITVGSITKSPISTTLPRMFVISSANCIDNSTIDLPLMTFAGLQEESSSLSLAHNQLMLNVMADDTF